MDCEHKLQRKMKLKHKINKRLIMGNETEIPKESKINFFVCWKLNILIRTQFNEN